MAWIVEARVHSDGHRRFFGLFDSREKADLFAAGLRDYFGWVLTQELEMEHEV